MLKDELASGEESVVDLDTLLVRDIGQFGRFQWRILAVAVLVGFFTSWSSGEYIFTTAPIKTRCLIPECEVGASAEFSPPWLAHAVPSTGGSPDGCRRYAPSAPNVTDDVTNGTCPASMFDLNSIVPCEEYVFEDTNTVVYDLELACDEWRRSFIGSVRSFGMLVAMPITGFVSDRWGRRTALVINAVNTAWLGTVRYWINSYTGFVIVQFIEAAVGSATFSCAYILSLELVGPKYRVLAGAIAVSGIGLGLMGVALLAWLIPYWRHLTLALFAPQFLSIFYIWIVPESIRWYQSKGKFDKAEALIKKAARVNGNSVSEKTLLELTTNEVQNDKIDAKKEDETWLIVQVFQHKPILMRCLIAPVWWITTSFVYFGLSVNAVNIAGNKYLNFSLVSTVEVPGIWMSVLLVDRVGRRPVIAGGFWLCALCQLVYVFRSNDMTVISLLTYLVSQSCIAMVMTAAYLYTAELYPTQYRQSLVSFCAMLGYIGAIIAPLTPAMGAASFESLPFVLFSAMALLSGLLVLLTPETRGSALPDTMHQAARIGRKSRLNVEETGPFS